MKTEHNQMVFDLRTFHAKFGLERPPRPMFLSEEAYDFRIRFLQEELDEYKEAVATGSLEHQFDALLDLVYVAIGTADLQGFPWEEGWAEVQRANLSKVRATSADQSKRGSSLDVVKPAGFVKPNIEGVLNDAIWRYVEKDNARYNLEPAPL